LLFRHGVYVHKDEAQNNDPNDAKLHVEDLMFVKHNLDKQQRIGNKDDMEQSRKM
jgi:hypothetical protein